MIKKMIKNKKGFTLVEIIVVLVIMGILLAIAVPSILGYVSKANDQKYIAQARNGYVGAQAILTRENATQPKVENRTPITGANLSKEIMDTGAIKSANCTFTKTEIEGKDVYKIKKCEITVKDDLTRKVTFDAENTTSEISKDAAADGEVSAYKLTK